VQYHVRREDVRVAAADLLNTKVPGRVTAGGVRSNISTVLAYASAWLGGNGCIPLNHLMEDAATAEITRIQLWQWVHYGVRDDTGETITAEYVGKLFDAVVPEVRKAVPGLKDEHLRIVAKYLKDQISRQWPSEFLTSDLMPYLAAADGVPASWQRSVL
jgi:malate synthase